MSFREKSAWISFGCLLAFTALWFAHVMRVEFFHVGNDNPMAYFFAMLGLLLASEIGLHLAIAWQSPRDARTPKDEREKLIDLRASRVAFYALLIGATASIGTLHLPVNKYAMGQCIMGSVLLALLIRFATQIALYRRDA